MPIKHPIDGETLYDVQESSAWFRESGLKLAPGTLDKKRYFGTGPVSLRIGGRVWYRESALREYLLSRLSGEFSNTSEVKAARANGGGI
jgi:hypothetical protein